MKHIFHSFTLLAFSTVSLFPMYRSSQGKEVTAQGTLTFEHVLKNTQGGCNNYNRGLFVIKNNEGEVDLKIEMQPRDFLSKGKTITMQRGSEDVVEIFSSQKNEVDCIGVSPDGSKLIQCLDYYAKDSQGYSAGHAPILNIYSFDFALGHFKLHDSLNVREFLKMQPDTYMNELNGIAVSNDSKNLAFIHTVRDQGAASYGNARNLYRVSIINLETQQRRYYDLFQEPEREDRMSYDFISFSFSPDGSAIGLYYKGSTFSTYMSSTEGFNGGPDWQTSEHAEYKTIILPVNV